MIEKILFETDAFAATKEVWLKGSRGLEISLNFGRTFIKRFSPNYIQLSGFNGDVLAEFFARTSGNKKVFRYNDDK